MKSTGRGRCLEEDSPVGGWGRKPGRSDPTCGTQSPSVSGAVARKESGEESGSCHGNEPPEEVQGVAGDSPGVRANQT